MLIDKTLTPEQEAMYKVALVWSALSVPAEPRTAQEIYALCNTQIEMRKMQVSLTLEQVIGILEIAFSVATVMKSHGEGDIKYTIVVFIEERPVLQ